MASLKNTINLLVAEDDEDDLVLLWGMLSRIRFMGEFRFFRSGEKLLDYLRQNWFALPDVILIDVTIPGKDGIEILSEIRSEPKFAEIPVVIMCGTQTYFELVRDRHPDVPVDRVIIKPITVEALAQVLEPLECCVEMG